MIAGALFVLWIVVLGYGLLAALGGSRRWDWAAGAGAVVMLGLAAGGLVLFWLSLAGWRPTRLVLALPAVAAAGVIVWRWRQGKLPRWEVRARPIFREWLGGGILLLAILLGVLFVSIHALGHPNYEWDAYMLWGLKARVVTTDPVGSAPYFHDPAYSVLHQNYPLHLPFLMAAVNGLAGRLTESVAKVVFPLFYLGLGLTLCGAVRRLLRPLPSLILTAAFMLMPTLLRWAGAGYADVPLAAFMLAAAVALDRWRRDGERADLFAAAIFLAAAGSTKNEGVAFVIVALVALGAIVVWLHRARLRDLSLLTITTVVLLLPWLGFRQTLPRVDENYPGRLLSGTLVTELERAGPIAAAVLAETIGPWAAPGETITPTLRPPGWRAWNALWLVLLGAVLLGRRSAWRPATLWWALLAGHLAACVAALLMFPGDVRGLLPQVLDRLLLQAAPLAALLIASHWQSLAKPVAGIAEAEG